VASYLSTAAALGATFTDNFNAGASPLWQNEVGSWVASGGVYSATEASNFPNAHSSLPFNLTDFAVSVDVIDTIDGGIWLRGANAPGAVGVMGVLFVLAAGNVYFHLNTDPNSYGPIVGFVSGAFSPGDDLHVDLVVVGNTYSAFLNVSAIPATTTTTASFASGFTALYDNSSGRDPGHAFDNFSVTGAGVPAAVSEPPVYALLATLGIVAVFLRRYDR
jgi:hypothetical protein